MNRARWPPQEVPATLGGPMFKILAIVTILVGGQPFEPPMTYTYTRQTFPTLPACESFRTGEEFQTMLDQLRTSITSQNYGAEIKIDTKCDGPQG